MSFINTVREIAKTVSYVTLEHPLSSRTKFRSLERWLRWQLGTRILRAAIAVPFVGRTRLLVQNGMAGATGNVYCGLHDFEDMAFLLHVLRPRDVFVDVGANIGSYTVLASGVCKAMSISFEPSPSVFEQFVDNIRLNGLMDLVEGHNCALGSQEATLPFTCDLDTISHIATDVDTNSNVIEVPVKTLDTTIAARAPVLIKIDVEGYEQEVLGGARNTLTHPNLLAVIMEINGSGQRYNFSDDSLHIAMLEAGFFPFYYAPFERRLKPCETNSRVGNTLYVKDERVVRQRVEQASRFQVNGIEI